MTAEISISQHCYYHLLLFFRVVVNLLIISKNNDYHIHIGHLNITMSLLNSTLLVALVLMIQTTCCYSTNLHIFTIPQFEVDFVIDTSVTYASTPSHQLDISTKLKAATTSYLFDYFNAFLEENYNVDLALLPPVEGIHLEVNLHTAANNNRRHNRRLGNVSNNQRAYFKAEIKGSIFFTYVTIASSFTIDQSEVSNLAYAAFEGNVELIEYMSKIQSILTGVVSMNVNYKQPTNSASDTYSTLSVALLTVFILCSTVGIAGLVFREVQLRKYSRRRGKSGLLGELQEYSDSYDGNNGSVTGNNSSYLSFDSESVQFIPIPARFDEVSDGRKSTKKVQKKVQNMDVTPLRYVNPASPFELLYGAAFSHDDKDKVLSAHGMKIKKRFNKMRKQQKKGRQLKPLNTITEIEEEDPREEPNESFFPQIVSSISSYISDKMDSLASKHKNDDYRGFPRHDKTPYAMFSPVGGDEVNEAFKDELPLSPDFRIQHLRSIDYDDDSSSSHSSDSSVAEPIDEEPDIELFLDELEDLIAAKSRQYDERKKIYEEEAERKRQNLLLRLQMKARIEEQQDEKMPITDSDVSMFAEVETVELESIDNNVSLLEETRSQEDLAANDLIRLEVVKEASHQQNNTENDLMLIEEAEDFIPEHNDVPAPTDDIIENNLTPVKDIQVEESLHQLSETKSTGDAESLPQENVIELEEIKDSSPPLTQTKSNNDDTETPLSNSFDSVKENTFDNTIDEIDAKPNMSTSPRDVKSFHVETEKDTDPLQKMYISRMDSVSSNVSTFLHEEEEGD